MQHNRRSPLSSFLVAALGAASLSLVAASSARAQWSGASVYTEDGVELGVDARVFSLFATMNASGYDVESVFGAPPLSRPQYAEARQHLRANLGRSDLGDVRGVYEKSPASVDAYLASVLALAPNFDGGGTDPIATKLGPLLKEWYGEEGGVALLRNASDDAKPAQKRLLPSLDKAVKGVTSLVRVGDQSDQVLDDAGPEGRVVVALNELDAHGTLRVIAVGASTYVVAGPSRGDADDTAVLDAATLAYARTLVARDAAKLDAAAAANTLLAPSLARRRRPRRRRRPSSRPRRRRRGRSDADRDR